MIEGYIPKQDVADLLLDLRNYITTDIECWGHDSAKQALADIVQEVDNKLKEIT